MKLPDTARLPEAALPAATFSVSHHVSGASLASIWWRRPPKTL